MQFGREMVEYFELLFFFCPYFLQLGYFHTLVKIDIQALCLYCVALRPSIKRQTLVSWAALSNGCYRGDMCMCVCCILAQQYLKSYHITRRTIGNTVFFKAYHSLDGPVKTGIRKVHYTQHVLVQPAWLALLFPSIFSLLLPCCSFFFLYFAFHNIFPFLLGYPILLNKHVYRKAENSLFR